MAGKQRWRQWPLHLPVLVIFTLANPQQGTESFRCGLPVF
jgi:hypothetical protein